MCAPLPGGNRICAQVHHLRRLLRKSDRRHCSQVVSERNRNTEPAEQPPHKPRRLPAQPEDRRVRHLQAEVQQKRHRRMQPRLRRCHIHVLVCVGLQASRKVPGSARRSQTCRPCAPRIPPDARRPRPELPILDAHNLAVEYVHPREIPQAAESRAVAFGSVRCAYSQTPHGLRYPLQSKTCARSRSRSRHSQSGSQPPDATTNGPCRVDHVGRWRNEPAGLTFERQVLRVHAGGGKQCSRKAPPAAAFSKRER